MKAFITSIAALALAPLAFAADINVSYSTDFQETLEEDYGLREGERLVEEVRKEITREFEKAGISPARVDIVINDAKPNRPTFKQLGDKPGLDYARSISIGGADLTGIAYDADGNKIAEVQYDWYEHSIDNVIGAGTWSDADRAIDRFSRKLTEALTAS